MGNRNAAGGHSIRLSGKTVRKAARRAYNASGMQKSEKRNSMRKFRKSGGGKGKTYHTK